MPKRRSFSKQPQHIYIAYSIIIISVITLLFLMRVVFQPTRLVTEAYPIESPLPVCSTATEGWTRCSGLCGSTAPAECDGNRIVECAHGYWVPVEFCFYRICYDNTGSTAKCAKGPKG